jgi:hypothetical protein
MNFIQVSSMAVFVSSTPTPTSMLPSMLPTAALPYHADTTFPFCHLCQCREGVLVLGKGVQEEGVGVMLAPLYAPIPSWPPRRLELGEGVYEDALRMYLM